VSFGGGAPDDEGATRRLHARGKNGPPACRLPFVRRPLHLVRPDVKVELVTALDDAGPKGQDFVISPGSGSLGKPRRFTSQVMEAPT
jgi:hypothetical protein